MIGHSGRNERDRQRYNRWWATLSEDQKAKYNRKMKEQDCLFGWYFFPSMVPTAIFIYVISRFTRDPIIGMFIIMFFCANLFTFCMIVIEKCKRIK